MYIVPMVEDLDQGEALKCEIMQSTVGELKTKSPTSSQKPLRKGRRERKQLHY